MTRFFSEVCLRRDGVGRSSRSSRCAPSLRLLESDPGWTPTPRLPTPSAGSTEQRGTEEYAEPVVPDPALDRKFAVLVEEIGALLPAESLLDAAAATGAFSQRFQLSALCPSASSASISQTASS